MKMTAFESIEKMQRVINQANLSPAAVALSTMQSSISQQQFNQISGMSELLLGMSKNAFQQVEQINQIFATSEFQRQMENINRLSDTVLQSTKIANMQFANAMSILGSPTIKSQLEQMGKIGKLFEQVNNPALIQMSKIFEAYNSPAVKMQFESIQSLSQTTLEAVRQAAKSFELNNIEFTNGGAIVYEGVEYSNEAISEELNLQLCEAENNATSLKLTVDKLHEKFWLLILLVQLILFLPQLPETIDFYEGIVSQVYKAICDEPTACYIIKETAFMREEANAKSKVVAKLVYDTALEVLDTIPRWLNVKYTDEEGNEHIGWISKISVEMEESQNEQ